MYFLTYLSHTNPKITEDDLIEIMVGSRKRNAEKGITGMMLYLEGDIVHLIEGDEHDVIQLFSKIEQDNRHYGIIKLTEGEVPERNFNGWYLGYKSSSYRDMVGVAGFTNISRETFTEDFPSPTDHPSFKILKSFYDNYKA